MSAQITLQFAESAVVGNVLLNFALDAGSFSNKYKVRLYTES
jgi:hypothetical protein